MIQNLNFYDIYGYLIPGLILAILIWLPRGLIVGEWPTADWTSALVAVVIGYVLGHLVQILGRNALPSTTMDGRYPSEALLDKADETLSDTVKDRLRARIKELSGIDVRTDLNKSQVTKEVRVQRADGFRYCRDALLSSKTISYGEQMQGMYTLMDGLTVAFFLGAIYIFGWAISGTAGNTPQRFSWIFVGFGLVEAILVAAIGLGKDPDTPMARARLMVAFLMVALLASGYILGLGKVSSLDQRGRLGAITLVCTFASLLCYSAYKYFTVMYAQTIYRAFNLYEKPDKATEKA
jgi:hypothetical protein